MNPAALLYVAIGGAAGSVARVGLGALADRVFGSAFPVGTLLINIIGSFVIAAYAGLADAGAAPSGPNARALVASGLCGGFTTFSSFSLQTVALARTGTPGRAGLYVLLSILLCVGAAALGLLAGSNLAARR